MVWLLGFELSCGLESRLESCQQLWAFGVEGKKSQMNRGKSRKNSDHGTISGQYSDIK